jgi:hypothetical protein
MKDVVPLTTQLFEMSKETAKLEATNFELRQKVVLASELKQVLDSWVRFEQGQKQSEQEQLVKAVIEKVTKALGEEKTQKDILLSALTEVERELPIFVFQQGADVFDRTGQGEGDLRCRWNELDIFHFRTISCSSFNTPSSLINLQNLFGVTKASRLRLR